MRKFKHTKTGIVGTNDSDLDSFLHFERGDEEVVAKECISMYFIEDSNDWKEVEKPDIIKPTDWFKHEQIETWIGLTDNGENPKEIQGGRAKLIVLHQCGNYKYTLIDQLKTMIHNIEADGEGYAS
tara:strand:+ start:446 stop:823 length:378 start_codon:yes stop_codon:yes gene_type:complete